MVATKNLSPSSAVVLLFLSSLTNADPTKPKPLPYRALDVRIATGSASVAASSNSSHPASKSTSVTESSKSTITGSSKIIATETNEAGAVNGCTSVSLLQYTDGSSKIQTMTNCVGSRFPVSTIVAMASSEAAMASSLQPVSVPATGCAMDTKHDGSNDKFCTCAGSGTASASSVSTMLGYYRMNTTTVCNTGKGSLPTGYVEVPELKSENINNWGVWATPPSDAVAGNCTDVEVLDPSCWESLFMDEYVKWWWGAFNNTCHDTAFAECFFIAMTPYAPTDCSIFGIDPTCTKPDWSDFKGTWNDVRNAYVAWNLYNINKFFGDYWISIGNTVGLVEGNVGEIVKVIDTAVKKKNVMLDIMMQVLTSSLAFVPSPAGAIASTIAKNLLITAAQSGFITKLIMPMSESNSQLVQMQDIAANASNLMSQLQVRVSQTLPPIQNNVTLFATAASNGAFSSFLPNLQDFASNALKGFNAYIISQTYQANDVMIVRQLNTSVRALMTNGTKLSYPLDCSDDYDSNGICGTFWYDSVEDITYSFMSKKSNDRWKGYHDHMLTWFPGYTDPEIIFRGASHCAASINSTQGSANPVTVSNITGAYINNECLSNMRVCTWSLNPGAPSGSGLSWDPLFTDCSDLDAFSDIADTQGPAAKAPGSDVSQYPNTPCKGVGGSDDAGDHTPYLSAWRQYLGWGIYDNRAKAAGTVICRGDNSQTT